SAVGLAFGLIWRSQLSAATLVRRMKLEHPLAGLVDRCQTICVAECCGIDAFDFSPIHIASFLILYLGGSDAREVSKLREQLAALKANYGSSGASDRVVTLDEFNQRFSEAEVDALVDKILENLEVALGLIGQVQSHGRQNPPPPNVR